MFIFFFSLVVVGSVEKCLTELKMPNILPGEREDIKRQVTITAVDASKDIFPMFLTFLLSLYLTTKNCGLV